MAAKKKKTATKKAAAGADRASRLPPRAVQRTRKKVAAGEDRASRSPPRAVQRTPKKSASKPAPAKPTVPLAKPAVAAGPPDPTVDLAQAVAALALDRKAEEVLILKVTDLTSYADCFILASAPSERQVQAIARHVGDEMKKGGKAPVGIEGLEQGHWVLVDLGAIVLHVFLASARRYYDLEGFWSDAPRVDVDEARGLAVHSTMVADRASSNDGAHGAPSDADDAEFLVAHDARVH